MDTRPSSPPPPPVLIIPDSLGTRLEIYVQVKVKSGLLVDNGSALSEDDLQLPTSCSSCAGAGDMTTVFLRSNSFSDSLLIHPNPLLSCSKIELELSDGELGD